jgi:hypothetical protein
MDGPAEESVAGRWFYSTVKDDTTLESDQEAAKTRENCTIVRNPPCLPRPTG